MRNEPWTWARDWAWIGASTSAVAPLVAGTMLPIDLWGYAVVAGLLGALSGALVGLGLSAALDRVPPRSRVSMTTVIAPVPLGAWGGAVATLAAALTRPDLVPLALACGTVAALAQTIWLAPLYVWLDRGRLPLAVGSAVVAPFSGVLGMLAGLMAMDGLRWLADLGVFVLG